MSQAPLAKPQAAARKPITTVAKTLPRAAGMKGASTNPPTIASVRPPQTSSATSAPSTAKPIKRPARSTGLSPRINALRSGRLPVMLSIRFPPARRAPLPDPGDAPASVVRRRCAFYPYLYARRPMLGTYACFCAILLGAALVGQGVFCACGRREWSWLAPAVGLAVITAVAWGGVRLPGDGAVSAIAIGILALSSLACLRGRVTVPREAAGAGVAVAVLALVAASLPFFVEGRFGILGTGLNPDMSQHLFAADGLAHGAGGRLLEQGYPLGPHSLAVAASKMTGASRLHAFDGLTVAVAVW